MALRSGSFCYQLYRELHRSRSTNHCFSTLTISIPSLSIFFFFFFLLLFFFLFPVSSLFSSSSELQFDFNFFVSLPTSLVFCTSDSPAPIPNPDLASNSKPLALNRRIQYTARRDVGSSFCVNQIVENKSSLELSGL
ncbi:hypothetical protein Csa_020467 [Cucumis sativus]|uniref:Uncharacterized protein n=1 Tax=Cucumis sativus TaxID=3659 RepID=A0A0A0K1U7_CUCSA|nr:hypothetical protein Csa_020467 [Cucumis sativus]